MGYHGITWASKGFDRNRRCFGRFFGAVRMRVLVPGVVTGSRMLRSILVSFPSGECQTTCKPGSVRIRKGARRPFLWDAPYGAPRATNPGGGTGMFLAQPVGPSPAAPIRSCSRWGLPCRPRCRGRGALLPRRFTLARGPFGARAVCFLWHFPWGRPRRPLAGTAFPWSPDFPPPRCRGGGRPAVWREGDRVSGGRRQAVCVNG
jgi:hypothetical protein